jgi:hypothetical protein
MYLFARNRRVAPANAAEAIAAALEAGAKASEITGVTVFVWTPIFSGETGQVMWSGRVDSLEQLVTANDALIGSTEFQTFISEREHLFEGPLTDTVSEVIHAAPSGPPGAYIQVVQAVCAHGSIGEGMATSVELAEAATRLTGQSTMVVAPVAGPFGALGWITSYPDLTTLRAGNEAARADAEWMKLIDRAGHVYQPGVTTTIMRRLA